MNSNIMEFLKTRKFWAALIALVQTVIMRALLALVKDRTEPIVEQA